MTIRRRNNSFGACYRQTPLVPIRKKAPIFGKSFNWLCIRLGSARVTVILLFNACSPIYCLPVRKSGWDGRERTTVGCSSVCVCVARKVPTFMLGAVKFPFPNWKLVVIISREWKEGESGCRNSNVLTIIWLFGSFFLWVINHVGSEMGLAFQVICVMKCN